MALAAEWKSKRVFRAVIGYGVVVFALLQIIEPLMHGLHLPEATLTWALAVMAVAFPVVLVITWWTDRPQAGAHLHPGWMAGAGVALLAVLLSFLALRRSAPVRAPRLQQLTFAGAIEEDAAWAPDARSIAYAAQAGAARKIFRKDLTSGQAVPVTRGDADDRHPAFSPDASRLFFMRASGPGQKLQPADVFGVFSEADLWQVDLKTGRETRLVERAYDPAVAPDGRIAVDASWAGARRIWVLDASGQNAQQVTTDSTEDVDHTAPHFSPDGKKIVFQVQQRTKFDVRVVNLESKQQTAITDDFALDVAPAWSPSGKYVYFTSDRGGGYNVWRAPMDAEGKPAGALEQVTTGAGQDVEPAPSPDGRSLAFTTLRQNADVWALPVDPVTGHATGEPQPVIATTREESRGAWSPDGQQIAFNSDRAGDMNIWIRSLRDGADRQITSGPGGDFQPNWSPDAKQLAFFSSRLGRPRIFVVELASGAVKPLTAGTSIEVNPFFSPDGKWVAFQSDRTGRAEVWVIPAAGGEARQLSRDGAIGHFVRWTREGDAVLFSCRCGGRRALVKAPLAGGEPVALAALNAGSHMSFSPDGKRMMDVLNHRVLTVFDIAAAARAEKVYEFPDPSVRIDYPVWSPDGTRVLFERNHPEGGDIWVLRDIE